MRWNNKFTRSGSFAIPNRYKLVDFPYKSVRFGQKGKLYMCIHFHFKIIMETMKNDMEKHFKTYAARLFCENQKFLKNEMTLQKV